MGAKRKPLPQGKVSHVTDLSEQKEEKAPPTEKENTMFKVRSANKRIEDVKGEPIPQKLFGSFIYEQGLTIFFGNTHSGKTVVAMNMAEAIASGNALSEIEMEAKPQKVVYFDFELSDKNFELKSSDNYENHFTYSDNLIMTTPDLNLMKGGKLTAKEIIDSITAVVSEQEAKVFFVDNISWLETEGLETTKEANKLMKELWLLSRRGYAVIVLAHTTKKDDSEPMTFQSLAGSAAVSRYLESCLAINWSIIDRKKMRYLKQLKNRWGEEEYGHENVLPIIIGKDGMLTFHKLQNMTIEVEKGGENKSLDLKNESSHLTAVVTVNQREEFVKENVIDGKMSLRIAASLTNVSHETIRRDVIKINNLT
tara:strand:+ start:168 stop:1268 length:1101 start_codon:yes stop_codon:yes gene_type:complete